MKNLVRDTILRLVELNQLQDELDSSRRFRQQRQTLQTLIDSHRSNLLPNVLFHHDRMRMKGKTSVAAVYHGVCSACHMALAVGNVNSLLRGDELRRCGNCGRYVYMAEKSEALGQLSREIPRVATKAELVSARASC